MSKIQNRLFKKHAGSGLIWKAYDFLNRQKFEHPVVSLHVLFIF